jgi:hypothetical protein
VKTQDSEYKTTSSPRTQLNRQHPLLLLLLRVLDKLPADCQVKYYQTVNTIQRVEISDPALKPESTPPASCRCCLALWLHRAD